jgi:hypothetical protein
MEALFTVDSSSGLIKKTKKGLKLVLNKLEDFATWWSDRPDRYEGSVSTRDLVEGWQSYFNDSEPNVSISYIDKMGDLNSLQVEVIDPKLKRNDRRVVAKIEPLTNESIDHITGLNISRKSPIRMKDISMVIDEFVPSQFIIKNGLTETDTILRLEAWNGVPGDGGVAITDNQNGGQQLLPGEYTMFSATMHDTWDLTVQVNIDDADRNYRTMVLKANNPWYAKPQFQLNNETTTYYASETVSDEIAPYWPTAWENPPVGVEPQTVSFVFGNLGYPSDGRFGDIPVAYGGDPDNYNDKMWYLEINSVS